MPSGPPIYPPLRGYVPYGELLVDRDRQPYLMAEIPMWEGADLPLLKSWALMGQSLTWVRPSILGGGPSWTWNPNAGGVGHPHSGHNAIQIYAETSVVKPGGQGVRYENLFDPTWVNFITGRNYAWLLVGTPLVYSNPGFGAPGNSYRNLITWRLAGSPGNGRNVVQLNYGLNQIRWQQGFANSVVNLPRLYRERVALLFIHGEEYGQSIRAPRVYVGEESGLVTRYDFSGFTGTYAFGACVNLELFLNSQVVVEGYCAGGNWEYAAFWLRNLEECEAEAICRDALVYTKWDAHVPRRVGRLPVSQLSAEPMAYGRVSSRPLGFRRVVAVPAAFDRVSASPRSTGPRVAAEPSGYQRISARVRIADKEADVQATPLCPAELNFDADNVLELADVMDEMQDPPAEITSATSVTCEIWDRETDTELTVVSPVTLNQVGATNHWRNSVLVNAANGFAINQRLMLVFIFDGGVGLRGRFVALAVVVSATS